MRERKRLSRQHNPELLAEVSRQGRRLDWLADQLKITRYALWRYTTGRSAPPVGWYEQVAAVLGVDVDMITPRDEVAA